jgi:hypothetical protein
VRGVSQRAESQWEIAEDFEFRLAANLVRRDFGGLRLRLWGPFVGGQPRVPLPVPFVFIVFLLAPYPLEFYRDNDLFFLGPRVVDPTTPCSIRPIVYIVTYPLNLFYVFFNLCLAYLFSHK